MSYSAELAAVIFAACNSARVLAYIPQIVSITRDRNGSPGISCLTWAGFAAANVSTVAYSFMMRSDFITAAVFGVNAVFCLAIVTLTVWTRLRIGPRTRSTSAKDRAAPHQQGFPVTISGGPGASACGSALQTSQFGGLVARVALVSRPMRYHRT
jgi:hypothetical protein